MKCPTSRIVCNIYRERKYIIMMMSAIHTNQHSNTIKFKSLTVLALLPMLDVKVIQKHLYQQVLFDTDQ